MGKKKSPDPHHMRFIPAYENKLSIIRGLIMYMVCLLEAYILIGDLEHDNWRLFWLFMLAAGLLVLCFAKSSVAHILHGTAKQTGIYVFLDKWWALLLFPSMAIYVVLIVFPSESFSVRFLLSMPAWVASILLIGQVMEKVEERIDKNAH